METGKVWYEFSVRFGEVYRHISSVTHSNYVSHLEKQAQIHLTVGPIATLKELPPPSEGSFPVNEWVVFTNENALTVAKHAGNLPVTYSMDHSANQKIIDKFMASVKRSPDKLREFLNVMRQHMVNVLETQSL